MGKEGALGVAKSAKKPIQPISDASDYGDRSDAGYTQSSLWSGVKPQPSVSSASGVPRGSPGKPSEKSMITETKLFSQRTVEQLPHQTPSRSTQRARILQAPS